MATRVRADGKVNGFDRTAGATRKGSWMERLARRLELSVADLWIIILTVASIGVLYLIGEVARRLGSMQ
ncbi:MAG: hypothetical protein ACUVRF_01320 [Desulfotomaculales bacterium]